MTQDPKQRPSFRTFPLARSAVVAVALALAAGAAADETWNAGEGTVTATGTFTMGSMMRMSDRSAALIPSTNGAVVGQTGTAPGGRNSDDGDLNFDPHDLVSTPLHLSAGLEWKQGESGAVARAMAWYDDSLENADRPFGNIPNGYTTGTPLGERGFSARQRFGGVALVEANAFRTFAVGPAPLQLRAGWQRIPWGVRTSIAGGLGAINPDDYNAATRPGSLPDEAKVPVPAVYARLGGKEGPRAEAFYELWRAESALPGCGTFFQGNDFVTNGCDKVLLTPGTDAQALASGGYVERRGVVDQTNAGQFGVGIGYAIPGINADFGAYYARYHSRTPVADAIKTSRTSGSPFVPGNPDGLNAQYQLEYPSGIHVLGLTAITRTPVGLVSLELTYRPNQPVAFNGSDLLAAFTSNVAPTPLRADATATPFGGVYPGYDRREVGQAILGFAVPVQQVLGAKSFLFAAEAGAKQVFDLPDSTQRRYGRSDVFGLGPVNGACTSADPVQCADDGFVTAFSWGYRARVSATWGDEAQFAVTPTIAFLHDVRGYSPDGAFNAARKSVALGVRSETRSRYTADVTWVPTWGGTYNAMRDRSFATASVGVKL